MPFTPGYGWPYQHGLDQPHGPNLGANLALAIEATLQAIVATLNAADADLAADLAATSPVASAVTTLQSTTSTSYTDLATAGPAVTVTTGSKALVVVTAGIFMNAGSVVGHMGFAVSGSTTIAAADADSLQNGSVNGIRASATKLVTGLTPGSNTFTAKYRVTGSTGNFFDRSITVVPVP